MTGKRAWWWIYFTVKTLITKYDKGTRKAKIQAFNEEYSCNICKNFSRKASKLRGSTSALSKHIKGAPHRRTEDQSASQVSTQTGLDKFVLAKKEDILEFEDAMVNWIIDSC
jgi:hypothetical protein